MMTPVENQQTNTTMVVVTPEQVRRASEAEDEKEYQEKLGGWQAIIHQQISKSLFPMMQFIASPQDEQFGSAWQRGVCFKANVPNKFRHRFWSKGGGMMMARKLLNRRRQNTTMAMKVEFMSKAWMAVDHLVIVVVSKVLL